MFPLINQLWSDVVGSPLIAVLILLAIASILAAIVTLIQGMREGLAAKATTVDDLHRDAYTVERRKRLRGVQGGRGDRRVS